jgi:hypothetical protein
MGEKDRNMNGNVRAAVQLDSASDFLASGLKYIYMLSSPKLPSD